MNRRMFTWAFSKLTRLLTYKAEAVGIQVVSINEAYSSVTCHRCGQRGQRAQRGLFRCTTCGLNINADQNAAFNLLNRGSGMRILPNSNNSAVIAPTYVARFNLKTFHVILKNTT